MHLIKLGRASKATVSKCTNAASELSCILKLKVWFWAPEVWLNPLLRFAGSHEQEETRVKWDTSGKEGVWGGGGV